MFIQCRILDKNTNQIFYGQIDTEFEGQAFYELVEISDDGKLYKWNGTQVVEDTAAEQARQAQQLIQQKTAQATAIYNQADPLLQAIFFNAFQWISTNLQNPNLLTQAINIIQNYPIPSGLTPDQVTEVNTLKQQLLQIFQS